MLRDELNIKYLPESMILRFLRNESGEKEKFIVERLKTKEYNLDNFLHIKELLNRGNIKKEYTSQGYEKFLELAQKQGAEKYFPVLENGRQEPRAGQIWTTKSIPQLGNFYFEPVVFPKFVYILTNPQPYQPLDSEDYVLNFKEFYTLLVLPVSLDTEFSTHKDYIVLAGNNTVGLEFMIETWLETNMVVCNLEKCVGTLAENSIDELLNLYYASNKMEYDKILYDKAFKGKYHDKDYGEIYEFQKMEEENIEYLSEPVDKLYEFLADEMSLYRIRNIIDEPMYSIAADDENVNPPQNQNYLEELLLFKDDRLEFKIVVLDNHQLYIRLKIKPGVKKGLQTRILILDKITQEDMQVVEGIDLEKLIHYFHIEKMLKNRLIEFSFYLDNNLLFIKNLDFRKDLEAGAVDAGNKE